jgi:hypothetical protein
VSVYDDRPVQDTLDGLWTGKIARGAAGLGDTVDVVIRQFDPDLRFGPCRWQLNGNLLPQRGQDCVVSFSEEQRPYVIAWWTEEVPVTPETPGLATILIFG